MFELDLIRKTEIKTCYFKLQPLSKEDGRNLDKPRTAFGNRIGYSQVL